jgi:hypothetical protein
MPSLMPVHVHGSEQIAHRVSTKGMVFKAIHRFSSRCLLLSRALAAVPDTCCLGLRTRALRWSMHSCMPTATIGSNSTITAPSFSFFVHACIQIAHRDITGVKKIEPAKASAPPSVLPSYFASCPAQLFAAPACTLQPLASCPVLPVFSSVSL